MADDFEADDSKGQQGAHNEPNPKGNRSIR
jgi:hypothetical protein